MTLSQVVNMACDLRPNAFSRDTLTAWINEIEGQIQTDILLLDRRNVRQYDWQTDQDEMLIVKPPHDKLYCAYVVAQIDFANGEYDKYANSAEMANSHLAEFTRWFSRNYRPAERKMIEHGYYLKGFSPTIEVIETETGHEVIIHDVQGTISFDVLNGKEDLPPITAADNGKIPMAINGLWVPVEIGNAEDGEY